MKRVLLAAATAAALVTVVGPASAASIIDEWASVKVPPPPALKAVTVDPKTTAVLVFDIIKPFCNPKHYAHCPGQIPTFEKLLAAARAKGVLVVYTSIPAIPKSAIVDEIAPKANDPFVQSFTDKFLNTDLDKILKDHGIKTVIVTGLSSNGAVIESSSEAALRGFKVVVALDLTTAATPYAEQFTAWQLVNGPVIAPKITLSTSDMIKF
jgi:nicotinamidase-related amidase